MKVVLTGGTDGIGLALTKKLINLNHEVVVVGKDVKKAKKNLKNLDDKKIKFFKCDLSEKKEIIELIERFNDYSEIDILINNAGAIFDKRVVNSEGIEKTFALNHLSHLQLSLGLRKKIEKSRFPMIVNISSNAHKFFNLDLDDLQNKDNYNGWKAYCRAKLLNILITYSFKKETNTKINCNCIHPGFVNSNFGGNNNSFLRRFIKIIKNYFAISNEESSSNILKLITSDEFKNSNGKYFDKIQESRSSNISYDIKLSEIIWNESIKFLK